MSGAQWIVILTIVALYVLLLGDWFHRAGVALALAAALVLSGTISARQAFLSVDWNIIFLLSGMMVVVAYLRDAGLFGVVGGWALKYAKNSPRRLLLIFVVLTGVISAFLDNVTTILLLSPIIIEAANSMDLDPIPFLLASVVASNLGGLATLIGDPPNMIIGTEAHLSFVQFLSLMGPLAVLLLVAVVLVLPRFVSLSKNPGVKASSPEATNPGPNNKLVGLLVILAAMLVAFILQRTIGVGVGYIALIGALLATLYTGGFKARWYRHIDYGTVLFFIGVFVIVGALESSGLVGFVADWLNNPEWGRWLPLALFLGSAIFSAFLDNVPLTAAMVPVISEILAHNGRFGVELWIALGMGAAIGGNATVIGASANVVAQGIAEEAGYHLSFRRYARFGLKIALYTAIIGALYLEIRF